MGCVLHDCDEDLCLFVAKACKHSAEPATKVKVQLEYNPYKGFDYDIYTISSTFTFALKFVTFCISVSSPSLYLCMITV